MEDELPNDFFSEERRPRRIGDVIADLLEKTGLSHRFAQDDIREQWLAVLGDAADHTRITSLRRNVLYVEVDSAPWLHELANFRKEAILQELQQKVTKSYIAEIKFRLGSF